MRFRFAAMCLAGIVAIGCHRDSTAAREHAASTQPARAPSLDARNVAEDDGNWTLPGKNYQNTRFSGLTEITKDNVENLRVAWTFSTGVEKGHEAAPLVVNGTMYVVTPYPNYLYAIDLSKPGGAAKWTFKPEPAPAAQGVACCDVVDRGASFADGKIVFATLDDWAYAVDAETGKPAWKTKLGDINRGETITMAPLVVNGRVYVGNSGGELGVRGWLTALDVQDGHILWRAYTTGPDSEVLIGPRFHPHYDKYKAKDLGVTTWPPDKWKIGGGTVWGFVSYDPDTDSVIYGTANPGPWNPDQRPGDNLFTAGMFARDAKTGEALWYYQFSPHDLYDYDGVNEAVLVDLPIGGQTRKVLLHPDRDGYLYVIDRGTGEVLSAEPYGYVTTSHGVDLKTGEPRKEPSLATGYGKVVRGICPASAGAKDWQPSAFSPRTGLLYIPQNNLCQDEEGLDANYIAGTPYVGADVKMYAGPGGNRGAFTAWDPVAGKKVWSLPEKFPAWSGALVTAGDVVFYGTMEGWFKAIDARSGDLLWQFKTGSGVIGQPISYRGPDGKQYIAVLSGVGGWAGAVVSGDIDVRDQSAALGFANAMNDLPDNTTKGGMLYVFALP